MLVESQILSEITTFLKYSKYIPELQRRESWEELVDRNKNMHVEKYPHLKDEIEEAYKFVYEKKVLPSMRSLQFAGKPIDINNARLYNCCFLPMDHPDAFSEVMFLLLSGTGVGYSVQSQHVEKLPAINKPTRTRRYLVGDSIEGWADAVKVLVSAYMRGKAMPVFDFRDIRPKGAMLITSGGKAPGPEPLKDALHNIQKILDRKQNGEQLTTLEVHDINCFIADAVLSGGIRRSAMISLFDIDDEEMLTCKFGSWWETNAQRGRSNNSAVIVRHKIEKEVFLDLWKKIEMSNSGEPGFFFTNDPNWGLNPCITGDALITVRDHDTTTGGEVIAEGSMYQIPLKQLVELYETSTLPPMVLSYNTENGVLEWDKLDAAALTREKAQIIELELDDGTSLKLTPDHKVYTENRGWIEAANLTDEDVLITIK
jgi:ribonucleoside-triphosphate reductase (thioredoxin)